MVRDTAFEQGDRGHEHVRHRLYADPAGGLVAPARLLACRRRHRHEERAHRGQIGREPGQAHIPPGTDAGTQWKVALGNVVAVLKAAGGQPTHLVALRAYVTDIAEFNSAGAAIGAAWGATLGRHFPAMTLVQVSALIDPNAKVEIEAEAILP